MKNKKILSIIGIVFSISLATVSCGYALETIDTAETVGISVNPFKIVLNTNDDESLSDQTIEATIYHLESGACGIATADIWFCIGGNRVTSTDYARKTLTGNYQVNFDRTAIESYAISEGLEGETSVTIEGTITPDECDGNTEEDWFFIGYDSVYFK